MGQGLAIYSQDRTSLLGVIMSELLIGLAETFLEIHTNLIVFLSSSSISLFTSVRPISENSSCLFLFSLSFFFHRYYPQCISCTGHFILVFASHRTQLVYSFTPQISKKKITQFFKWAKDPNKHFTKCL